MHLVMTVCKDYLYRSKIGRDFSYYNEAHRLNQISIEFALRSF